MIVTFHSQDYRKCITCEDGIVGSYIRFESEKTGSTKYICHYCVNRIIGLINYEGKK